MALSRYSVLPEQQIFNTRVDQDLGLVNKVLAAKQAGYDQGEQTLEAGQELLEKVKVINGDVADKNRFVQQYLDENRTLVDGKYQGDYGEALPELRRRAQAAAQNPFFQYAARNYEVQQDADKRRSALKSGAFTWDNTAYSGKTLNQDGSYNNLAYSAEDQLDWVGDRKKALGDLKASGGSGGLSGSNVDGLLRHVENEGVDLNQLQQVAYANFQGYLGGASGSQERRSLIQQGYSDKQAQQIVLTNLISAGTNQVYSKSKTGYVNTPGYAESLKDKKEAGYNDFDYGSAPLVKNPYSMADAEWSEDGNSVTSVPREYGSVYEAYQKRIIGQFPYGGPAAILPAIGNTMGAIKDVITGSKEAPTPQQAANVKALQYAAKRNNMSAKDLSAQIKDINPVVLRYKDPKKAKAESELFYDKSRNSGNFTTRKVFSDQFPGGIQLNVLIKDLNAKLGKKPSEPGGIEGFTVIGEGQYDNPYSPKTKALQYMDETGEPQTVWLDDSPGNVSVADRFRHDREQARIRGSHTFSSRVVYNSKGELVPGNKSRNYRSTLVIDPSTGEKTVELKVLP